MIVWGGRVSVGLVTYPAIINAHTPIHCNRLESMDPGGDAVMNRSRMQTAISNTYHHC